MTEKLLDVENLTMKFGGLVAIDNLSFWRLKIKLQQLMGLMELEKQPYLIA